MQSSTKDLLLLRDLISVGECIRELGEVPSGHLYARLMGKLSLESYEAIIRQLVKADLVKRSNAHLLTWIGPVVKA